MNKTKPSKNTGEIAPHYFIMDGLTLKSIRKELRPALPKGRYKDSYLVVFTATTTSSVKVAIAGAEAEFPAITSGSFTAEIPYVQVKTYLSYPYESVELVRCELAPGSFSANGMATKSPAILVKSCDEGGAKPTGVAASIPDIVNPLDATIGLPLLAAYAHIRKYGIQRNTASETFAGQQLEVNALLNRVHRLLRPVGITRANLEFLLDKKVGLPQ